MGLRNTQIRGFPGWLIVSGALCLLALFPRCGYARSYAQADSFRTRLADIDAEMRSIDTEWDHVDAQAVEVKEEISRLDRQSSLGPLDRQRYSELRRQSEQHSGRLDFLQARRGRLSEEYGFYALKLLRALGPEIDLRREAYEREPADSQARVTRFQEFETLVLERQKIRARLARRGRLLYLELDIEPDDTPESLREKADLMADNRDLLGRLFEALNSWKRELIEDREILEEVRRLEAENDFFSSPDPMGGQWDAGWSTGSEGPISLPPSLADLAPHLELSESGETRWEDLDSLIVRIERVEHELGDDIRAMDGKHRLMLEEAARREGDG